MAKQRYAWIKAPSKSAAPKVPDGIKFTLTEKANGIVETTIKPRHLKPPPTGHKYNYIADIYTKWYRHYFYFCATYNSPSPNALSPSFELKFAWMEFVAGNKFNLAYMRHTKQWFEVFQDLPIDDCLELVAEDPMFMP